MGRINLEMDVHEALIVQGRLADAAFDTSIRRAKTRDNDEAEHLDVTGQILNRVVQRLTDAIYPTCVYPRGDGGDVCGKEFAGTNKGHAYCRFHLELETMRDGTPA